MEVRFVDETDFGLGWIHPRPGFMERASHALVVDGRVWVIDPTDGKGVEVRVRALGEPAGVIQLLDRHGRDCAAFGERLDVHVHVTPFAGIPDTPFRFVELARRPSWREVALWWPERRVLVTGDAIGTTRSFRAPGDRLAVHPFLRLKPPRALAELDPEHVLCGHGAGVHGPEAAPALREALATARRRVLTWPLGVVYSAVTRAR
jgi:hypothetical protein